MVLILRFICKVVRIFIKKKNDEVSLRISKRKKRVNNKN